MSRSVALARANRALAIERGKLGLGLLAGQHCGAEFGQRVPNFGEGLLGQRKITLERIASAVTAANCSRACCHERPTSTRPLLCHITLPPIGKVDHLAALE